MWQAQNVTSWMIFANIIKFAKHKDFSKARPPVCASSTVQLEDLSPDAGHAGHGVQVTWTLRWHLRKGAKNDLWVKMTGYCGILQDIAGRHWFLALNSSASLEILKIDIDSKHSRRLFFDWKVLNCDFHGIQMYPNSQPLRPWELQLKLPSISLVLTSCNLLVYGDYIGLYLIILRSSRDHPEIILTQVAKSSCTVPEFFGLLYLAFL